MTMKSPKPKLTAFLAGRFRDDAIGSNYDATINMDVCGLIGTTSPIQFQMNPQVKFGRPCISGTGITVETICGRYRAGESIADIAADYGRSTDEVKGAIYLWRSIESAVI